MTAVLVQPFGLLSPGGGPKILRSHLSHGDVALSVATGTSAPPGGAPIREVHLPAVRLAARLQTTRLAPWREVPVAFLADRLGRRLDHVAPVDVSVVHGLAHGLDFQAARALAARRRARFVLSVHDDLRYAAAAHPRRRALDEQVGEAWRRADSRLVISDEMGDEYDRRYGRRDWVVVTDGVPNAADDNDLPEPVLDVYFVGAVHLSYEPNFATLGEAMRRQKHGSQRPLRLTCRGSAPKCLQHDQLLETRPWADDVTVREETRLGRVLYLPLPFGKADEAFTRFSLPTKLVAYLSARRPILYHGPGHSPAARLLSEFGAGVVVDSPDVAALAAGLERVAHQEAELLVGAARLVRDRFDGTLLAERFRTALGLPVVPRDEP